MPITLNHATSQNRPVKEGKTFYKISFATVCMNRLHHIRQTLPKNIGDNKEYEHVEFILLDYNSSDGLEEWVREHMQEHIQSGKLTFYRTTESEYFKRSHSRNMALRMATGDIICNVDADNYTGGGFAEYINERFNLENDIFLAGSYDEAFKDYKDAYGRFCSWRKDFNALGGYDEAMESYGHEDTDLYERLIRYGRKETRINDTIFLHSIPHSDKERTSNEFFQNNLYRLYMTYINDKRRVLFLYKNKSFEMGTLVENYYSIHSPSSIEEKGWLKGNWEIKADKIFLSFVTGECCEMITDNDHRNYLSQEKEGKNIYSHITNPVFLYHTMLNYSIITNSNRIHLNEIAGRICVNEPDGMFGQGTLYKNFTDKIIL